MSISRLTTAFQKKHSEIHIETGTLNMAKDVMSSDALTIVNFLFRDQSIWVSEKFLHNEPVIFLL